MSRSMENIALSFQLRKRYNVVKRMENTEAESVMERDVIAVGGGSAGAVLATRLYYLHFATM
jgi:ribulose 1,5-bisphosphate synthetase/thiazole synthase